MDCELSCAADSKFEELSDDDSVFGDVSTTSFVVACVICGLGCVVVIFIVYLRLTVNNFFSRYKGQIEDEVQDKTIQIKVNEWLEDFFRKWGTCKFISYHHQKLHLTLSLQSWRKKSSSFLLYQWSF